MSSPKTNNGMLKRAIAKLTLVLKDAEKNGNSGWCGVEVLFRDGQPKTIRTRIEHTEQ